MRLRAPRFQAVLVSCRPLGWTEAVTLVSETHIPGEVYEFAHKQFSDEELVNLTIAIITINGWNRLEVGFRGVAGLYLPRPHSLDERETG